MWGFHLRSLPKVWRTMIQPGVKFLDLFILKNMWKITLQQNGKDNEAEFCPEGKNHGDFHQL